MAPLQLSLKTLYPFLFNFSHHIHIFCIVVHPPHSIHIIIITQSSVVTHAVA